MHNRGLRSPESHMRNPPNSQTRFGGSAPARNPPPFRKSEVGTSRLVRYASGKTFIRARVGSFNLATYPVWHPQDLQNGIVSLWCGFSQPFPRIRKFKFEMWVRPTTVGMHVLGSCSQVRQLLHQADCTNQGITLLMPGLGSYLDIHRE